MSSSANVLRLAHKISILIYIYIYSYYKYVYIYIAVYMYIYIVIYINVKGLNGPSYPFNRRIKHSVRR